MNRNPVPTLDACLSKVLREEQRIATHVAMEHKHKGRIKPEIHVLSNAIVAKDLVILQRLAHNIFVTTASNEGIISQLVQFILKRSN